MDERLIQQQEQELAKTGRYYLHVCFMTIPLLCMACFLYGLRPLLLCGAALLTVCDVAARTLFAPYELPVGVVLSLAGGPFFLWLLFRKGRGHP